MPYREFEYLLNRFLNDQASAEDRQQIRNYLKKEEYRAYARQWIESTLTSSQDTFTDHDVHEMFSEVIGKAATCEGNNNHIAPVRRAGFLQRTWLRYAAAVLVILGAAAFVYYYAAQKKDATAIIATSTTPQLKNDVLPGGNKAILTLSDGSVITLDNAGNGQLASQGITEVVKLANGQLSYVVKANPSANSTAVTYNTLETPRGGQYQVLLPDGTKVWLNAVSSITFPTVFTGKERNVSVTGEVYFEVAKDKTKPFRVKTRETEIEVLGTQFNVNAYDDEQLIKTTLLEGSVKVSRLLTATAAASAKAIRSSLILLPGQQADQYLDVKKDVDVQQITAWKNGLFKFNRATIQEVTRQLSRWYNVDVVFEKEIPKIKFAGEMQRSLNLSEVLEILDRMGVKFRIDGKKLIIK